jgi:uncharacterized heparinase superfamily protein
MNARTPFAWYARRLAAMSPREIAHRFGEQARRQMLRRASVGWSKFDLPDRPIGALPAFVALTHETRPGDEGASLRDASATILDGHFAALGQEWPRQPEGAWRGDAWFRDPVTGGQWPGAGTFCFDVRYRHDPVLGDVKYVWELNRLQFLQPIAISAAREKDAKLSRYAIDTVLSWMEANPPFQGINWVSGIELSLRLVSLAVVSASVGDALNADERKLFHAFVAVHAYWLERFPSLFSSANNHRVAEGLGLVVAALLAPESPSCGRWMVQGRAILEDAVESQFFSDGIGVEQTPTYSAFTLEMLGIGAALLNGTPHAFGPAWLDRLARAAQALEAFIDDTGCAPRIGDDDEGHVIAAGTAGKHCYPASVISSVGSIASQHDKMPGDTAAVEPGLKHFAQGGYTIVRDTFGNRRAMLVFDHSLLGFGAIAAHGHADALAIWLHVDGKPVFADSGTYLYHSGGAWRDFFRSTAAHNTVEVAGLNQSIPAGAFNWRHKARAKCTRFVPGDRWEIEARHDGYRSRLGIDHERTLRRTADGFRIEDRLPGARGPTPVAIRFLVHPERHVALESGVATISDEKGFLLRVMPSPNTICRIVQGEGDQIGPGWYSPSFGRRVPAPCIVFEGQLGPEDVATTDIQFQT